MDLRSNLSLLSEAASFDTKARTSETLRYDAIKEAYENLPEVYEACVTEAADVIVTRTSLGEYYVEMMNLAPFMRDSDIHSISRALELVEEANNIPYRGLTLVVESQDNVDAMLENASKRTQQTGNRRYLENALNKLNDNNAIITRLLTEGRKVAKKGSDKVCPKCGKASSKCVCKECDGANGGVIKEYAYSTELTALLNEATETYDLEPVLEFFKFKDHNFKSKGELKSYIKKIGKEEKGSQLILSLIGALLVLIPFGGVIGSVVAGNSILAMKFLIAELIGSCITELITGFT